ncbi:MAG: cytochrome c biogenesis CcdA family protein [Chloroflexota bacterium]
MDPHTLSLSPLTLALAVGSGLLSFVSPCVLPLVPAYVGYVTGLTIDELESQRSSTIRINMVGRSLAFVLGLSVVFSVLGGSASAVGHVFSQYQTLMLRVAGVLVVVLGLHTLGLIRIPLLYQDRRPVLGRVLGGTGGSYGGALLLGAAFAAGWTPCIGPFLAGLLALASQEETVSQGMLLLFVYGLGLGIPFVLTGLVLGTSLKMLRHVRAHFQLIETVSGLTLVGMGLLIFSDRLSLIAGWLTGVFGSGLAT